MTNNERTNTRSSATKAPGGDIIENPWFAWTLWIASIPLNLFVGYLCLVFYRAAGAGVDTSGSIGAAAAGVAISVAASAFALFLKRHILGIILIWAMLPIGVLILIVKDGV